jgi:hypothetical protein
MKLILLTIVLMAMFFAPQRTFTCQTACEHRHNQIREKVMEVTAWDDCAVFGVIDGKAAQLWADGSCPLREKVPGKFRVKYDAKCGQVLEMRAE